MNNILIYSGLGTSVDCIKDIYYFLKNFINSKYEIKYIYYWNVINENWEDSTELIVFPGGADSWYEKNLGEIGCKKIRSFIKNGGKYLGICAGAYFAGNFLEFAKGTDLEIIEKRSLALFEGTTFGPILKPYNYNDDSGACAAKINFSGTEIYIYYNGGGTFIPDSENSMKNVEITATYTENNLPAIIKCHISSGIAILSGVHFETLGNDKIISNKIKLTKPKLDSELKKLFDFL